MNPEEEITYREPQIKNLVEGPELPDFSWKLCTQDPDNPDNILLWRYLSQTSPEEAIETGRFSGGVCKQSQESEIPEREVFMRHFEGQDLFEIAGRYVVPLRDEGHEKSSPILHTSYDRRNAISIPYKGVAIEYSVPKRWILDHEKETFATTGGETEVAFFYGLPEGTIKKVSHESESGEIVVESVSQIEERIASKADREHKFGKFQF